MIILRFKTACSNTTMSQTSKHDICNINSMDSADNPTIIMTYTSPTILPPQRKALAMRDKAVQYDGLDIQLLTTMIDFERCIKLAF